jgi:hypothetical protein
MIEYKVEVVSLLNDLNRIFFLQTSQKLEEVCPPINLKVRTKDRDTSHISRTDVIGGRTMEDHTVEVRFRGYGTT